MGSTPVQNGAQLTANTRGQGDAGNVIINAQNHVSFINGDAFSTVEATGVGQGGNVEITTGSLDVLNGAFLIASTRGQGDAGNVIINAQNHVSFVGTSADGGFFSGAFSEVEATGVGQGGNVGVDPNDWTV